MAKLAKKYKSKEFVYDILFVGIVSNGYIFWHYRKNNKLSHKTKII